MTTRLPNQDVTEATYPFEGSKSSSDITPNTQQYTAKRSSHLHTSHYNSQTNRTAKGRTFRHRK